MSTWRSKPFRIRSIVALSIIVGLSACAGPRFSKGRQVGVDRSRHAASSVATIAVADRNIVIEGPSGFCVDRKSSQIGGDVAFILLGNCRVVAPSSREQEPDIKALLTASVSSTSDGSLTIAESVNDMDRFFRSENGRTALSRDSNPASVKILETFQKNDTFYLRASDTSSGIVPGAADDYWRSYFDLDGQIVSVSVIGFKDKPLSAQKSLQTAQKFTQLIRERNGNVQPPLEVTQSEPAQAITPVAQKPARHATNPIRVLWTVGLLRRLVK